MNYMARRTFTSTVKNILSIAFVSTAMLGFAAPAYADAFDVLAKELGEYYGAAKGKSNGVKVPDFHFTRSEFETTFGGPALHLLLEAGYAKLKGYTVVYYPGTNAVKVYKDAGNGYSEPTQTREMWETCGPGSWFITTVGTNPENNKWCTPAHLVGKSGGLTEVGTIPGTARKCTFDAGKDGFDIHSC
jgi:hypothetical protein